MIKKLQVRFTIITTAVLLTLFLTVFITLNAFMYINIQMHTDTLLRNIAEQDGVRIHVGRAVPSYYEPKNFLMPIFEQRTLQEAKAIRFFYVKLDYDDSYLLINYDRMFDFTAEEVIGYVNQAIDKNKETGTIDNFHYLVMAKEYGKIMVFAETSTESRMLNDLTRVSLMVLCGSSLVLFVFSILVSKWALKPAKTALEKQRRFISDASHELKTPLTIISTNADVLENEIGHSLRIDSIKTQSNRMGCLIHDLLTLAKTDEITLSDVKKEFNLSSAVLESALEFESRAFEEGKSFESKIEEGIFYTGIEVQLRQVVSVLIDNALKHSEINDEIKISLSKKSSKITLCVFNTGTGINSGELDKIFERFYRSDTSRSRKTGGYGLGLAIAKSIVETHKGKISASSEKNKWTKFTVVL